MNESTNKSRQVRLPLLRNNGHYNQNTSAIDHYPELPNQKTKHERSIIRNHLSSLRKRIFRGKYIVDYCESNFSEDSPLRYPVNPFACMKKPPLKKEHKLDELIKLPAIHKGPLCEGSLHKDSSLSPRAKFFQSLAYTLKNQSKAKYRLHKATFTSSSPITKKSKYETLKKLFNGIKIKEEKRFVDNWKFEVQALNDTEEERQDIISVETKIDEYVKQQRDCNSNNNK